MLASSNWRSGPLGLWEAFDTDYKIVWENEDYECQIGKSHWSKYVQGWEIWPEGSKAENVDSIDWGSYDIVISIDIAVPTRIIRQYPHVMWCYYFIEGGPKAIDGKFRGSPFFGYNVFLNHRLSKQLLTPHDLPIISIHKTRRAVLDFPYYLQSAKTIQLLHSCIDTNSRSGIIFSHHSYSCLTTKELSEFEALGTVYKPQKKISDIHRCELLSKFFVVHPSCKAMAGVGVIEAISAGCLVLAPQSKLWGFPELLSPSLEYQNIEDLITLLRKLKTNILWYETERSKQATKVQEWCFKFPIENLIALNQAFKQSECSRVRQIISEKNNYVKAKIFLGSNWLIYLIKYLGNKLIYKML